MRLGSGTIEERSIVSVAELPEQLVPTVGWLEAQAGTEIPAPVSDVQEIAVLSPVGGTELALRSPASLARSVKRRRGESVGAKTPAASKTPNTAKAKMVGGLGFIKPSVTPLKLIFYPADQQAPVTLFLSIYCSFCLCEIQLEHELITEAIFRTALRIVEFW